MWVNSSCHWRWKRSVLRKTRSYVIAAHLSPVAVFLSWCHRVFSFFSRENHALRCNFFQPIRKRKEQRSPLAWAAAPTARLSLGRYELGSLTRAARGNGFASCSPRSVPLNPNARRGHRERTLAACFFFFCLCFDLLCFALLASRVLVVVWCSARAMVSHICFSATPSEPFQR